MAVTRSMTRNEKHDTSGRKKCKTFDDGGSAPWSNLIQDILIIIMMKLGIGDFLSFSWVCSSWRSCALSNRVKFMECQPPMLISFVNTRANKKECYLQDSKRRKFKNMLPNCNGRICYGVSCGYLILYSTNTNDLWLVNPITRCELHFPDVPILGSLMELESVLTILVYSRSISAWMFLFSLRFCKSIWYSIAGKQTGWNKLYSDLRIKELCAFNGKVYIMHERNLLCEMRLNPEPTLTLLEMKNVSKWYFSLPKFVSSDEKLYVLGLMRGNVYEAFELDFDKREWVPATKTIAQYAFFLSDFVGGAAINPEMWVDPGTRYETCVYFPNRKNSVIGGCNIADIWYFLHDSLNDYVSQDDDSV